MKLLTSRIESGDKSGIQDLLQGMNVLTRFTELREKTVTNKNAIQMMNQMCSQCMLCITMNHHQKRRRV